MPVPDMRPRRGTSRRDHAPAATAGGTDVGNGDAASLTDAHLRMVRWMGMAFTGLQFAVYTPPTGLELPFPRSVGLLIALPLATLNIIGLIAGASWGRRFPRGWPVAQLAVDAGVVSALLWLFAFDATNALWGLLLLPMLQAALRFRLAGSVWTWTAMAAVYAARDAWAAHTYPHVQFNLDSVTFRLGVAAIVACATGSLTGRLHKTSERLRAEVISHRQATEQVEGLRQVATSARNIAALDVETVLRELRDAVLSLGFDDVRVVDRPPAGILPAPTVTAVLTAAELPAWPGVAATDLVVAVPMLSAGDVTAVILAASRNEVPRRLVEALELLAAHGHSALMNARQYAQRQAFGEQLRRMALHDPLTGLPNRRLLQERLAAALDTPSAGREIILVLFDLDRFKEINDSLGHGYGNTLLREVATRLRYVVRDTDTAARLGGDEFAVLASARPGSGHARQLAERVQAALHEPFVVDGLSLHVEASLGVVTSARHGRDPERLLRAADVAMYAAKSTSSGIAEYEPELDYSTAGRLALLSDLRRALDVDTQLHLHYQPQVDLAFGQLVGVEALLRWVHPRRGLVSPAAFVPAAEGTGLIHSLTTHVLGLALEQLARWRSRGWQHPVAVNLSTRCLLDQSLPDRVLGLLEHHGVPTSMLRLEITESALMADSDRALRVLQTLHEAGIRLSIDDFGTGYSSMSYLKRLPVDELKIDRCFVKDMTVDCGDATLVRTVVEMGHNLGLQVVAEGIEDEATLLALAEIGCDIAQGFHIASPMPAAEFDAWQTRRRGAVAAGRRRRAVAARP